MLLRSNSLKFKTNIKKYISVVIYKEYKKQFFKNYKKVYLYVITATYSL